MDVFFSSFIVRHDITMDYVFCSGVGDSKLIEDVSKPLLPTKDPIRLFDIGDPIIHDQVGIYTINSLVH